MKEPDFNMTDEPHSRLTELAAEMCAASLEDKEDLKDVQAIILLEDPEDYGSMLHGYERMEDVAVRLMMELRVIMAAMGKKVEFATMPDPSTASQN